MRTAAGAEALASQRLGLELHSRKLCMRRMHDRQRAACRYLMEVGSTRLPLKGIVDDTIGQRLQYEAANQRELSPLFAAIQKNSSLRLLAVSKMQSPDVLEVRHTRLPCHLARMLAVFAPLP